MANPATPAANDAAEALNAFRRALDEVTRDLKRQDQAITGTGLGRGGVTIGGIPSIVGGGSGAIAGARAGFGGAFLGAASIGAEGLSFGLRTGDLSGAAALSGRSFIDAMGSLPFIGELFGFTAQKAALNRTESRANEALDEFARFNLPLSADDIASTIAQFADQEARVENQRRNKIRPAIATAENLAKTAPEGSLAQFTAIELLTDIRDLLQAIKVKFPNF